MRDIDREELAAANGKDGKPVYIAYQGKVFNVSDSKLWQTGLHMNRHAAGSDLSAVFSAAPHGEEVFERYPQVGTLVIQAQQERTLPPILSSLIERYPMLERHPHPMAVHFPIVFFLAAALFNLLLVITGNKSFETTALHCLILGIFSLPFGILTGLFTWWLNYLAKPMKAVILKMILSSILLLVSVIVLFWSIMEPDILDVRNISGILYLFLVISFVPLVSVIGWLGGGLTFPAKTHSS